MIAWKYCPQCSTALTQKSLDGESRLVCAADGCGFVAYDNPTPVVAGLVEHEGNVVLVRNKGWPDAWFGLVSGFLEHGEAPEEGMLREVREELGLAAEIVSLIGVYPFTQRNEVIIAYHVQAAGEIVIGEELSAFKSILPDKLRPWPMGTGLAVSDWLARRAQRGTAPGIPPSSAAEV